MYLDCSPDLVRLRLNIGHAEIQPVDEIRIIGFAFLWGVGEDPLADVVASTKDGIEYENLIEAVWTELRDGVRIGNFREHSSKVCSVDRRRKTYLLFAQRAQNGSRVLAVANPLDAYHINTV